MTVKDRDEAARLIAADPFATEGLIEELTIVDWDPLFGSFSDEASRNVQPTDGRVSPGQSAALGDPPAEI